MRLTFLFLHSPAIVLFLLVTMTGCRSGAKPASDINHEPINVGSIPPSQIIGRSVEGRAIEAISIEGGGGSGSFTVLIIASIHGSEPAGTPLVNRLIEHLQQHPDVLEGRRVILVPNANPDGFFHVRRGNMRGVDLNRNFPSKNFTAKPRHGQEPLSEPESQALFDLIQSQRPDRVISIHQPLACIDWDGPPETQAIAQAMSAACDPSSKLPVKKLGALPGSFGSYVGVDLGIPTITLELPGHATAMSVDELWRKYGAMMLAGIQH